jgi:hypothetical protein
MISSDIFITGSYYCFLVTLCLEIHPHLAAGRHQVRHPALFANHFSEVLLFSIALESCFRPAKSVASRTGRREKQT